MNDFDPEKIPDDFLFFAWENLSPRDRAKVLSGSPRTAWVFGAGASHHYNLNSRAVPMPLANGFFEAFHKLPTSEGFHAFVGPLIAYLAHSRGIMARDAIHWTENIEDFMTSVESELSQMREMRRRLQEDQIDMMKQFSAVGVFNNMSFICANVINEAQNGPSYSVYRYLLDFCGPDDSFITFNWDTLLDRALADSGGWTPNNGYGISFASVLDGTWKNSVESSPVFHTGWKLLKLHGSTNWLVPYTSVQPDSLDYQSSVPQSSDVFLFWQSTLPYETYKGRWRGGYAPTCYCFYPPNIPVETFTDEQLSSGPDRVFISFSYRGIFCPFSEPDGAGIPSSPLIVTPVREKRYDIYESKMESIWSQSADCIAQADRIIIIGYSFPPTDIRPLELLRDSLAKRGGDISVQIVGPDAQSIAARIGDGCLANAKSIDLHSIKFEEYLEILADEAPKMLKRAATQFSDVKDWLERIYFFHERSDDFYRTNR
jgi:hypothetical protein